jgi:transposase
MRGTEGNQKSLFSYVSLESRIPKNHPLRRMRSMVDEVLEGLDQDFEEMYSQTGRPSIPPEQLLRASIVQVLYSVRSERLLMEQLDYNLLFRWFVGLGVDDAVWDHSVFSKNRDRLLEQDISRRFLSEVVAKARKSQLLSSEHFTVDGTFIEAWASHKSFQKKDGPDDPPDGGGRNATADFKGEKRSNTTHESRTDPDARLMSKGGEGAKLVHGHVLTENRNGLVLAMEVTVATGRPEQTTGARLLGRRGATRSGTVGGDKAYDDLVFISTVREQGMTPHVAQNISRTHSSYIDGRTTRHVGYAVSQRRRKMVEEVFGWMKTVGILRKARHRGTRLVNWIFEFTAAVYNLVRMRKLILE